MRGSSRLLVGAAVAACVLLAGQPAQAITITLDTNAMSLANAVAAPGTGMTIVSATLYGHTIVGAPGASSGTYVNPSGTYLLNAAGGIVLSSGNVADYEDGPNLDTGKTTGYSVAATAAQEALLDPITGGFLDHYDVTQLDIVFDLDADHDTVYFNCVFGSDEFDEYVGSSYIDAFGLYVNGANIAFVGGNPVNIDHPDMQFMAGTELDGILAPGGIAVLAFSQFVGASTVGNLLTFIIADSGDDALDSAVYIEGLGGEPPPPPIIPEPATISLLMLGLAAVGLRCRRKK